MRMLHVYVYVYALHMC